MSESVIVNLPFFPGFYESMLSETIDNAEQRQAEYDAEKEESAEYYPETYQPEELRLTAADYAEIIFDCMNYSAAYQKMARDYVDFFDTWAADNLETAAGTFTFESMDSPREYNFRTDRVYATVPLAVMESLLNRVDRNRLSEVIRCRFTSYDGFISSYSNNIADWLEKPVSDWDHNELGTLLVAAIGETESDLNWQICEPIFETDYEYIDQNCDWEKFESAVREKRAEKLAAWIESDADSAARYIAHHAETLAVLELALGELDSESRQQWEQTAGIVAARYYRCPFTPDMFPESGF